MVKVKLAIFGKANSGKNTLAELIVEEYLNQSLSTCNSSDYKFMGFADPIKEMAKIMFPDCQEDWLYGASNLRDTVIPGAFKNGIPLTVRQLLIDLGTEVGRAYCKDIWLNTFSNRLDNLNKLPSSPKIIVISDCRFPNELTFLKEKGFYTIRLKRQNNSTNIKHSSETDQNSIPDSQFVAVVNNDSSLEDLRQEAKYIINNLTTI